MTAKNTEGEAAEKNTALSDSGLLKNDYYIRHVAKKYLFNSILSMIFLYAGSLIDTLIVGAFLGEQGLGAMSLVSPVYLVFYTVGATLGIGGSITASQALGHDDIAGYRKIFTLSALSLFIAASAMCLLFYVFIDPIVAFLSNGAGSEQLEMAKSYLLFYIPGGGLTMLSYVPLYFLKTDGRPKASSALFAMSSAINIVLSWYFMSPAVNMGIAGASLATSISMGAVVVVGFILMQMSNSELRFVRITFGQNDTLRRTVIAGIPNGMSNLMESARIFLVNRLFLFIGASAFLSCYTVVRNVTDILSAVIIGISSAMLPLIGVFYGEEDYVSERQVLKLALKSGIIVMTLLTATVSLLSEPIFRLFGVSDPLILNESRYALPLSSFGLIAAYINTLYIEYLTAIRLERLASVLVVLRLFAVLAAIAFPLSAVFAVKGIWLSLSLAEIITLLLFFVIRKTKRKKNPCLDRYLLDQSRETSNDITFSVQNNLSDIVYASEHIENFCQRNDIDLKKSMRISLAIEEILTFLIKFCASSNSEYFIDIRIHKMEQGIMMRFRYVGSIFNPLTFYSENIGNAQMQEELLGLKLIFGSAVSTDFRQTLGANNLMIVF